MKTPKPPLEYDARSWPQAETRALLTALDTLADADGRERVKIDEFCRTLAGMAAAVAYGDCCERCDDWPTIHPLAVEHTGGDSFKATYRCPAGHKWTTGWSTLVLALR